MRRVWIEIAGFRMRAARENVIVWAVAQDKNKVFARQLTACEGRAMVIRRGATGCCNTIDEMEHISLIGDEPDSFKVKCVFGV